MLAWGGGDFDERGGVGLLIYDLADGRRRHSFGRQWLDVQEYGGYAYAVNSWNGWRVSTVDVSTEAPHRAAHRLDGPGLVTPDQDGSPTRGSPA